MVRKKFFRFLKDRGAYAAWVRRLREYRDNSWSWFIKDCVSSPEKYEYLTFYAFPWMSEKYIDWFELNEKWRKFSNKLKKQCDLDK